MPSLAPSPGSVADRLATRAREQNAALMRGDAARWHALARIADDFTLLQPFGGPASRGFDAGPERLARLARDFRNGRTSLEIVRTCVSDTLAVLVMVERQRAEVGGLPDQDWSLRVTEVYRATEDGEEWQLVHRHADPLLRPMSLERTAALARGADTSGAPCPAPSMS